MAKLQVNGKAYSLDVEPEMPLLWALRNELGLTGTKYGCGIAQCGACTVLVEGKQITTIEGLGEGGTPHPVQAAWIAEDVPQCGYCQSGQILSAVALLKQKPNPSDADISTITNICRCGTYVRVRRAIHRAVGKV
jgi:isoquinoline 1-oxidoreductase alpha subunit